MRIFFVISDPPVPEGEAVEVVNAEVIRHALCAGHEVVLQLILRYPRNSDASARAEERLSQMAHEPGCTVLPPLYVEDVTLKPHQLERGVLSKVAAAWQSFRTEELFPAWRLGLFVDARVRAEQADVLLSVWSWEGLAASCRVTRVPKLMYYGNPDHLPEAARLRHPDIFDGSFTRTLRGWVRRRVALWRNRRRKALHLWMMRQCEITVNNSALDARFYAAHGHPCSLYLQNLWPPMPEERAPPPISAPEAPVKLIGSVGRLGATGNSFGLHFLGKELLPRLAARFAGRPFEVHLFGHGEPAPGVARYLDDPRIIRRGWVDDLAGEIRSAHAFLVLTNASPSFLVGNTRILLAWALRTCVVTHANSALAMPELQHGENILLGRDADAVAEAIIQAVDDLALRRRIGEGGYATFQRYYRSDVVLPKLLALLGELVATTGGRRVSLDGVHSAENIPVADDVRHEAVTR